MQTPSVDLLHRITKYARAFLAVAISLGVLVTIGLIATRYVRQQRNAEAERQAAPAAVAFPDLRLSEFRPLPGTSIFRAQLVAAHSLGRMSYENPRSSHNLLFANSETGDAHWLLEDNTHELFDLKDLPEEWGPDSSPPRVSVVLVKPRSENPALTNGDLLIFSPSGDRIVKVADNVRVVAAANLVGEQTLSLVYERDRKFLIAHYALDGLRPLLQKEMTIPQLK